MTGTRSRVSPGARERRARIDAALERFASLRVLVVGDLLLDEYRIGDVDRISPEAPVPIVKVGESRVCLGGAGNVARGIVALGAACELAAVAGVDAEGARTLELLAEIGISTGSIVPTPDRVTSHKIRVIARGQQVLRLDREEEGPLSPEASAALRDSIAKRLAAVDVVILQDYDKGVFADGLGAWLIERARQQGLWVAADPKHDLRRFRGASLVKPNRDEARSFLPGGDSDFESRRTLLEKIQRELGGAEIVLTRGSAGMTALDHRGQATDVATRSAEVFDVQGAGDTSIAVLALCRAAGAELVDACVVANAAAAVAVEKMGTAAVDLDELRGRLGPAISASLTTHRMISEEKA